MKTACVALKQFLFAGMVLAVGQLFKTTKIHAAELQARGLARPATAEELQAQDGIDPQDETDESNRDGGPVAGDQPQDETAEPEGSDKPEQEDEPDPASGDAESSEEPAAPVPKRRARK